MLAGATSLTLAGTVGYVDHAAPGSWSLDLDDPLQPARSWPAWARPCEAPRAVAVQFRYAFVLDAEGLKVLDVTVPAARRASWTGAVVPLADAHNLYLARTYAYVAAGRDGPRHRGHRAAREARASTRPSTPAARSTTPTT